MRRNFSDSGRPVARRLSLARIVAVSLSGVLTAVLVGGSNAVARALGEESTLGDVAELYDLTLIATMKGWTIEEVRAHEYAADALIDVVRKRCG